MLLAAGEDAQSWVPLARRVAAPVLAAGAAVLIVGDAAAAATCEGEAAVGEAGSVVEVEGMGLAETLMFGGGQGADSLVA